MKDKEILTKLNQFDKWNYIDGKLVREFICHDFVEALSLTVKIGVLSEKINHHPNINLHSWNKVKITIFTHSENGITEKDFQLLELIETKIKL
ncbi:MAG: 4a-hydroxytetrahydrobiopterin dehydratase [Melioribacteraceae bacterium]